MFESGNRGYWLNEFAMLVPNEVETSVRLQTFETLLTGLENCSDSIQIVDSSDKIVYQNCNSEKVFGLSLADTVDKNVWDFFCSTACDTILDENDEVRETVFGGFWPCVLLLSFPTRPQAQRMASTRSWSKVCHGKGR